MEEKFIERGTAYPLRNGKLTVYETNCACRDIKFYFDQYVMTIMLAGHKTIVSDNLKFEFFPGTFFIPEKESINSVSIPNATFYNPTQCLVLELNPSFIQAAYEEVLHSDLDKEVLYQSSSESTHPYFLSNDQLLIKAFTRLYKLQAQDRSSCKVLVETLILKEILYRIFQTEGLHLLNMNCERSITDHSIRKVISHIRSNIHQKITTAALAKVAGLGQTTFFNLFKKATGYSPIEYLMNERIRQAKVLIRKSRFTLQEISYKCGFNSYEYFCSSFKKIEKMKPSDFKKSTYSLSTQ